MRAEAVAFAAGDDPGAPRPRLRPHGSAHQPHGPQPNPGGPMATEGRPIHNLRPDANFH